MYKHSKEIKKHLSEIHTAENNPQYKDGRTK